MSSLRTLKFPKSCCAVLQDFRSEKMCSDQNLKFSKNIFCLKYFREVNRKELTRCGGVHKMSASFLKQLYCYTTYSCRVRTVALMLQIPFSSSGQKKREGGAATFPLHPFLLHKHPFISWDLAQRSPRSVGGLLKLHCWCPSSSQALTLVVPLCKGSGSSRTQSHGTQYTRSFDTASWTLASGSQDGALK